MISAPIPGSCSRAKASSRPRVPPGSPTISRHHRVVNIHSCSLSPACPNGASRLCGSPAPKPSSEIEKLWTRTSDTADLLQESGFNFIDIASGCRLALTAAPMSHGGGCILRAPGGPVDLDRYPLAGNSPVDQVERCVRAGVGEEPRALADHHGIHEQGDLVDQGDIEPPADQAAARLHHQVTPRV